MSNQTEYFQHLVDTTEDPTLKFLMMEQLQKEQRRVAKKRLADRKAREEAEAAVVIETTDDADKPKRGRKPTKQEE